MPSLLVQNSKIKKTALSNSIKLFNFGIPAFQTRSGKRTCPNAGPCRDWCFARTRLYKMSKVQDAYEYRYEISKKDHFNSIISYEIQRLKANYIRVHDSGDYYSDKYMLKWFEIANEHPNVNFYSYTNMISMVKKKQIPENFDFIFSDSGTEKKLINKSNDRHTKIFNSRSDIAIHGYVDATDNDLLATKWFSKNNKIGLTFKK